jgi:hypothetical protein
MSIPELYDTPYWKALGFDSRVFLGLILSVIFSIGICTTAYLEKWRWKPLLLFTLFQIWLVINTHWMTQHLLLCEPK